MVPHRNSTSSSSHIMPPIPPRSPPSPENGKANGASENYILKQKEDLDSTDSEVTPGVSETETASASGSELDLELDFDLISEAENIDESLALTIVQEIEEGVYVCLVCTCEIDRLSRIWSCLDCFRVYDLECIRDWATRGSSTTAQRRWRCPACHVEHSRLPERFTCWCGRKTNPSPNSMIPFSCGNACDHKYDSCIHKCLAQCHPGKHPTCGALGPAMRCKCGAETQQLPCLMTPYQAGWQCSKPCDVLVCSMGHKCSLKSCHAGLCGPCKVEVEILCYCSQEVVKRACSDVTPKFSWHEDGSKYIGGVSCGRFIKKFYDCEIHYEDTECLSMPREKQHCRFAPDMVTSCYCGKTHLKNICRASCTDAMPVCDNVCGKKLSCGCSCQAQCHEGECVCFNSQSVKCGCGSSSFLIPCKAIEQGFEPICQHKCTALLSCRKHVHKAECCSYEQSALKRERENKRQLRNNTRLNFDDQILTMELCHICTRDCNQIMKCGVHRCQALCHSGPCGVCLESSAEDLVCHCGKTVIPAPVRCGTKLICLEQCQRTQSCGHRPERHACHDENVKCPRCTQLVTRRCECGLKEVNNVLCALKSVSCGSICSERKDCGHPCNRACLAECTAGVHAPIAQCQSDCRKIRTSCPHMCTLRCHSGKGLSCDSMKCSQTVRLTCKCGNLEKNVPCNAQITRPSGSSEPKITNSVIGLCIPCDDDCSVKLREKELRAAFNVSSPPDPIYTSNVLSVYRRQRNWCKQMENKLLEFVSNYEDLVLAERNPSKSMALPRMMKPQRDFVHELAKSFHLYSESFDREPNRAVFVHITEITKTPEITIEQAINLQDDAARKVQFLEELRQKRLADDFHNAILIKDVFFGVSKEDVERHVAAIVREYSQIETFHISWIKDSNYAFASPYFADMDKDKEDLLYKLLTHFKKQLRDDLVAFDCRMCLLDDDMIHVSKVDSANVMNETQSKEHKVVDPNAFAILERQMQ